MAIRSATANEGISTPTNQRQKLQRIRCYWYTQKNTSSNYKVKDSRTEEGLFSFITGAVCGHVMRKQGPALFVRAASFGLLCSFN